MPPKPTPSFGTRRDLLEADRVKSIAGGFYDVYNYFGYGLSESVYTGALELELCERGHKVTRELRVPVTYKGRRVAWQRLDMVVDGVIIVENKSNREAGPSRENANRLVPPGKRVPGRAPVAFRPRAKL